MLKSLLLLVFLLCHQGVLGESQGPTILGWPSWLLVDPEAPRHTHEEEEPPKARRIVPKSVFIAPAFSGSSPLPDCAEGYKADSMGRCVKLVQLNHAAQFNFLLQRLNAMYSTQPVEKDSNHEHSSSDSDSGPLHFTIPLEIPEEPEEETKESVEVAVVMADVLKDDRRKPEEEKSQTIVAVWKTGKNGTELEELETASDLEMEAVNVRVEKSNLTAPDTIKYDVVKENTNSTVPDKVMSTLDSDKSSSDSSIAVVSSESDSETVEEPSKGLDSAMDLLEEVSAIVSEDGRIAGTSRRNVSSDFRINDSNFTEEASPLLTEKSVVKKVLTPPEEIITSDSYPEAEVQQTSETVRQPPAEYQRPSSYVRFPSDNNYGRYGGGDNVGSYGGISHNSMGQNYVQFPQTGVYYGDSNSQPLYHSNFQRSPTYWWLPPGWRLDPSRHQPMLVRFWARLPLLRDPLYQNGHMAMNSYQGMNVDRRVGHIVY